MTTLVFTQTPVALLFEPVPGIGLDVVLPPPMVMEIAEIGPQGPQGQTGVPHRSELFGGLVDGQVAFELDFAPSLPAEVRMFVNGVRFAPPAFVVLGRDVTWANTFSLSASDDVEITYPV